VNSTELAARARLTREQIAVKAAEELDLAPEQREALGWWLNLMYQHGWSAGVGDASKIIGGPVAFSVKLPPLGVGLDDSGFGPEHDDDACEMEPCRDCRERDQLATEARHDDMRHDMERGR
jgi:hypothetical protein